MLVPLLAGLGLPAQALVGRMVARARSPGSVVPALPLTALVPMHVSVAIREHIVRSSGFGLTGSGGLPVPDSTTSSSGIITMNPAPVSAQMTESFPDKFSLAAGGFQMDYKRPFVAFDSPGTPFGAGTDVESKTVSNLLKFGYTYSFYHVEKVELGVGIGFHFIDMQFDADARERDRKVSEGGDAPLPNLGLIMKYRINSRFHIPTQFQFFFIEAIDDYRGSMTDFWVGLKYRAFRNFALGAAFNRFVLEASGYDTDFRGAANTTFNGLQVYLAGKF